MTTLDEIHGIGQNDVINLKRIIEKIRVLLPIQNPLYSYLHNNILMNWEENYFFDALERASFLYKASPYMPESYYNDLLAQGRIDLHAIAEAEKNEKRRLLEGKVPDERRKKFLRNQKYWETQHSELFSRRIQDFLVPLLSNFLDQGLSYWQNPWKREGFWPFILNYVEISHLTQDWLNELRSRLSMYQKESDLEKVVLSEFAATGLDQDLLEPYLLELSFDLKGWSGMINKLETDPSAAPIQSIRCKFIEYLAVRLIAENALNQFLRKKYQIQIEDINSFKKEYIFDFSKSRILHEAFEMTYRNNFIKKFKNFSTRAQKKPRQGIQSFYCIDDREESIRRHLEEVDPTARTYGVVGFFGVDMMFFPKERAKPTRQCPPVVTPEHEVHEVSISGNDRPDITLRIKSKIHFLTLRLYYLTRTSVAGVFYSLFLGSMSFIPLIVRIFFPSFSRKTNHYLNEYFKSKSPTRIDLQCGEKGYSFEEMAKIVRSILRYTGAIKDFSPLVLIIGHGSTTKNNPFKQAYGCGACSGNPGFPNARAFCQMANEPQVRELLRKTGIDIPNDVAFAPAFHDTCADEVFYDLQDIHLSSLQKEFLEKFKTDMHEACKRNALERVQFFRDINTCQKNKDFALEHVRARSMDLAQPRPEFGHARVSLTVVGRRELSLGFDLERRSFLVTYNPELDTDGSLLEEVAVGAVPVCANISLDYYFSRIDNEGFGAGTKLPLNITSLLGVMVGSKSDLAIGLGRQMVELHEPLRNLVFIEAKEEHIERLLERNKRMHHLVFNRWIHLVRIDPESLQMYFWDETSVWEKI